MSKRRGTFRDGPQAITQAPQYNPDLALMAPLRRGPTVDRMGFSPRYELTHGDTVDRPFPWPGRVERKRRRGK